jgi:hypothetical protein
MPKIIVVVSSFSNIIDGSDPGGRGLSARARVLAEVMTLNRLISPDSGTGSP